MKKIILPVLLSFLMGCSKAQSTDIPLSKVMEEIKVVAEFENGETIDLKNQKNAADYGINSYDISEGYVYFSKGENADEVIVVRAASKENIENVEKAVASELASKTAAWEDRENESKKIENHVMKTIGDCVLLAVGDKSDEIEQVFNQLKAE